MAERFAYEVLAHDRKATPEHWRRIECAYTLAYAQGVAAEARRHPEIDGVLIHDLRRKVEMPLEDEAVSDG